MPRLFNKWQRAYIFMRANGRCEICGCQLNLFNFHADHIKPYSKGGLTVTSNGQALCPTCNLSKGNKTVRELNDINKIPVLRDWQSDMFNNEWKEFIRDGGKWFSVGATPGAGKTFAALRIAYEMLYTGRAEVILVFTPTAPLKEQWAKIAYHYGDNQPLTFGISLTPEYKGWFGDDYHGAVMTYALNNSKRDAAKVIRQICDTYKTFIIFDEPHHMATGNSWGHSAIQAIERGAKTVGGVLLSGTFFRSDEYAIPFVEYERGKAKLHYEYTYIDALQDEVVRPIIFPLSETITRWIGRDGSFNEASFADELTLQKKSERYRSAIDPKSEFARETIRLAYNRTMHLRQTEQRDAKMLVVVGDVTSARQAAKVFEDMTGEKAHVVSSKDEDGGMREIRQFAKDKSVAIFSVNMISEGIDIPSLRVLVFLHTYKTQLFFIQVVGRVVRAQKGLEQAYGYVYIPADKDLMKFAEEIEQQVEYTMKRDDDYIEPEPPEPGGEGGKESAFTTLGADHSPNGAIIATHNIPEDEVERARVEVDVNNYPIAPELYARIKRDLGLSEFAKPAKIEFAEPPPYEKKRLLANECKKLAAKVDRMRGWEWGTTNTEWRKLGNPGHAQSSIEQLESKRQWLTGLING